MLPNDYATSSQRAFPAPCPVSAARGATKFSGGSLPDSPARLGKHLAGSAPTPGNPVTNGRKAYSKNQYNQEEEGTYRENDQR